MGIGSNNVIRFTCPDCNTQNAITCRMPKDFFRATRDANCRGCRTRFRQINNSLSRHPGRRELPLVLVPYLFCLQNTFLSRHSSLKLP